VSVLDVHRALAIVVAFGGVVVAIVAIGWSRFGRPGRLAVDRALLGAIVIVIVAIGSGLVLLAAGSRPADGLHLLYAAVALLVLPAVRFPAAFARRRGLAIGVGAVVLVALVVRLAQTG
jgi:hypothetical protein